MAGRPLDRARRESTRPLLDLLSLLGLGAGEPLLAAIHTASLADAFKSKQISESEFRILQHHASLSPDEQLRALGPRRSVTREDVDRLRAEMADMREHRKSRDEG